MKNTGKPYEALTEEVFKRLLGQTSVCAKVQRDVVMQGKSTRHQIDVMFEFVVGAVKYLTIVQAKDWMNAVKQEQLLTFRAILDDIPGQPRGIMVSRSGFQEGARVVAEHHGIKLYELREPRDEDWEGLVRSFEVTMVLRIPRFDNVRLVPDMEWLREEASNLGVTEMAFGVRLHPSEAPVVFETGGVCDFQRVLNGLVPTKDDGPVTARYTFKERAFVTVAGLPVPRIALSGVEATVTVDRVSEQFRVDLDHLIAYCFRDVLEGSVQFLGKDGGPVGGGVGGGGSGA